MKLIDAQGRPRPGAQLLVDKIESLPNGDLALRQKSAEALLLKMGIHVQCLRTRGRHREDLAL